MEVPGAPRWTLPPGRKALVIILGVNPRINFITLATADMGASRRFYVDGLGWQPVFEAPGKVVFLQVSPTLVLSLWYEAEFEAEVGPVRRGSGHPPLTLAHNVPTPAEVDAVLAAAESAGATVLHPAAEREWGGYSGYFTDPSGFVWEVAHNPGPVGELLMESEAAAGPSTIQVIRSRRSVGQAFLVDGPELDHDEVVAAVESARWAPNHKRTEPWRFYRLDEERKLRLAQLWSEQMERDGSSPERVEAKGREWAEVPGVVIVTCTSREEADELMRLEDYAATAAAVQNMCLHLWSKGIATKWSTAGVDAHEGFWPLLGHAEKPADTRLVAFIFYGLADTMPRPHRKLEVSDVLVDFRQGD